MKTLPDKQTPVQFDLFMSSYGDGRLSAISSIPLAAYSRKALADLTDTRLPEIRCFLKGKLDTDRIDKLFILMRKAGLPI